MLAFALYTSVSPPMIDCIVLLRCTPWHIAIIKHDTIIVLYYGTKAMIERNDTIIIHFMLLRWFLFDENWLSCNWNYIVIVIWWENYRNSSNVKWIEPTLQIHSANIQQNLWTSKNSNLYIGHTLWHWNNDNGHVSINDKLYTNCFPDNENPSSEKDSVQQSIEWKQRL